MLISIDWIKDFAKLPVVDPQELAIKFTMGTAEVEDVILSDVYLENISVAEITKIDQHPDADKLNLVSFNTGTTEKQVVCGAGNVKVGMKVPYAPLGTEFPNGLVLEPKKIRGVLSEGMLCSEEELNLAKESSGLMELNDSATLGQNMLEYLKVKTDILLDIDNKSLTHRPDLWGHFGLAREFSAVFKSQFVNPYDGNWTKKLEKNFNKEASPICPKVEKDSCCKAYFGLSLKNIKVTDSPKWMTDRLTAVGLRPINNIVDISNYVMLELGIPLHIFDRSLIEGEKIVIGKVQDETIFVTLDEIERKLITGDTVISDSSKPLVLAGIMGGLNSGVSNNTSDIFIEVANWKAAEVRKTSTRLGLRTDSSQRYEKTLDSQLCYKTLLRTLELILELCPGAEVIGRPEYAGDDLSKIKSLEIQTTANSICKQLGKEIDQKEIVSIFESLDFLVETRADQLKITVPTYRATKDIDCEADLVEEIGRIIGYDNISPCSPLLEVSPVKLDPAQKLHREIKNFLVNNGGCFEVMTYPLVGEKLLKKADLLTGLEIKILNDLSKDNDRLRSSMIPGFLQAIALNSKHEDEVKIFELGRTYHPSKKGFSEDRNIVAAAFFSKEGNSFLELSNASERLLNNLNIPGTLEKKHPKFKNMAIDEEWSGLHPYEFFNIKVMGKPLGSVFSIHPLMLRNFKIKGHLSIMLLDLSSFEGRPLKEKTKYRPISKFPGSHFDYTVEVERELQVGNVLEVLQKIKLKEALKHSVLDIFQGSGDKRSVTIRTLFGDPEKTLSGDFLKEAEQTIINQLQKSGFPLK